MCVSAVVEGFLVIRFLDERGVIRLVIWYVRCHNQKDLRCGF